LLVGDECEDMVKTQSNFFSTNNAKTLASADRLTPLSEQNEEIDMILSLNRVKKVFTKN
jgi:hypothetical protein